MQNKGVVEGKITVVTGGSAGIGRATVELFARSGACVTFAARRLEQAQILVENLTAQGHRVFLFKLT